MQEIESKSKIIANTKLTLIVIFMGVVIFLLYLATYLGGYSDLKTETALTKKELENLDTVIGACLVLLTIYILFKIFG